MAEVQGGSENFLKAIEKYAEEQRNKIRFESESFKKQELEKAEAEGIREAYTLIQREMAAIRTEISSQLSRDEMASRKKIFEKRNKMTEMSLKRLLKSLSNLLRQQIMKSLCSKA